MEEIWTDEYGVVYSADKSRLIEAPKGLRDYVILDGTRIIESYAFDHTSGSLKSLLIPDSVTEIEPYAFAYLRNLSSLKIPKSVTIIGKNAFKGVEEVRYFGDAEGYPWGAERVIDNKLREGTLPWGHSDPRDGAGYYYEGGILNGQPHGYGTIYHCYMGQIGGPSRVDSGIWDHGRRCDVSDNPADELTDEEWRDIN